MVESDAIAEIRAFEPALRAMGAEAAFLFGSTARGDQEDGSDVDVLLDIPPDVRFTLLDLASAQRLLSNGLKAPVHLSIRADLSARIVRHVMADAVRIF